MTLSFGSKTAAMRAIRNVSQIALAYTSGVNYSYISQAENGKRQLNADEQSRVRMALDWVPEIDPLLDQVAAMGFVK